jgi:hypothetical protein
MSTRGLIVSKIDVFGICGQGKGKSPSARDEPQSLIVAENLELA